jgi:lipoate-protein ligase A
MQSDSTKKFSHATWRLLITPPLDGATNMAIDEAILQAQAEGTAPPTLRFFEWEPGCLSLGYNQKWQDIDLAALERHGYTWTRRPTGGRAILHIDEATYSLITPESDPRLQGGIMESYRVLSAGLLRGLERLGLAAVQSSREGMRALRQDVDRGGPVCFDTPSRYEITWQHKKLIGSAQLRRKKMVLQHGTLPLHGDITRIIDVLAFSDTERDRQHSLLPRRATTLAAALGRVVPAEAAFAALAAGFEEALALTLVRGDLDDRELALAEQLRAGQYANESWLKRI